MTKDRTSLQYFQFNPSADVFEVDNALTLAKFSALIYQKKEAVEIILKEVWAFEEVELIESFSEVEDIQLYFAIKSDVILVAFRSMSESIKDGNTSTSFGLADFHHGKAHKGFGLALDLVWQKILEVLIIHQKQQQKIWLCGHSLGGVLATMAAHLFLSKKIAIQGLYTFGQPRAGDADFVAFLEEKLNKKYYRITQQDDHLCTLPTEWQGFKHAGQQISFDAQGNILQNPPEEGGIWQDTWSYGSSFYYWGTEKLPAHSIDTYVHLLAASYPDSEN